MVKDVLAVKARFAPGCENLWCSASAARRWHIALQRALNPPFYNLTPADRAPRASAVRHGQHRPGHAGHLLELLDGQLDRTVFNVISKSARRPRRLPSS